MKNKTAIQIAILTLFCFISFALGWLLSRENFIAYSANEIPTSDVITYSVKGIPTSFNLAWPTYGLPLANYESILKLLQNGHSNEAIPFLEAYLDAALYDAECRHPLLHGKSQEDLDRVLLKVARYREQFPRSINNSKNKLDQDWIGLQKNVDDFLSSFASTNAVK